MQAPIPDPVIPPVKTLARSAGTRGKRPGKLGLLVGLTWIALLAGFFFLHCGGTLEGVTAESPAQLAESIAPACLILLVMQFFLWIGKNWMRIACLVAGGFGIVLAFLNFFTDAVYLTMAFDLIVISTCMVWIIFLTRPSTVVFYRVIDSTGTNDL